MTTPGVGTSLREPRLSITLGFQVVPFAGAHIGGAAFHSADQIGNEVKAGGRVRILHARGDQPAAGDFRFRKIAAPSLGFQLPGQVVWNS